MAGTLAARSGRCHGLPRRLWITGEASPGPGWPAGLPGSGLVEELDELLAARHGLQAQRNEHRSLAPADHRHRIHEPWLEFLDLDA
jgi:hypothetical protein